MAEHEYVERFAGDEVIAYWEPAGTIILKAVSGTDPVVLTSGHARDIARHLMKLADINEAGPE